MYQRISFIHCNKFMANCSLITILDPFLELIMRQEFPIVNKRQSFATSPEKVRDLKINSEVTKHETKSHKYTIFSKDTTRVPSESNSGSSPKWEIVCQC